MCRFFRHILLTAQGQSAALRLFGTCALFLFSSLISFSAVIAQEKELEFLDGLYGHAIDNLDRIAKEMNAQEFLRANFGPPTACAAATEATSFEEAWSASRETVNSMQATRLVLAKITQSIKAESNADKLDALREKLRKLETSLESDRNKAIASFHRALKLADDKTNAEDVQIVKYFLSYLHFDGEDFEKAAELGEAVAREAPKSASAREAVKIALAARMQICRKAKEGQFDAKLEQVRSIADYTIDKWPKEVESVQAVRTMVMCLLLACDPDAAQIYLKSIPDNSPQQGPLRLSIGNRYLYLILKEDDREKRRKLVQAANKLVDTIKPSWTQSNQSRWIGASMTDSNASWKKSPILTDSTLAEVIVGHAPHDKIGFVCAQSPRF